MLYCLGENPRLVSVVWQCGFAGVVGPFPAFSFVYVVKRDAASVRNTGRYVDRAELLRIVTGDV